MNKNHYISLSLIIFLILGLSTILFRSVTNNESKTTIGHANSTHQTASKLGSNPNAKPNLNDSESPDIDRAKDTFEITEPNVACHSNCIDEHFRALLSQQPLSFEDMILLTSNPEDLVHFFRYRPELVVESGVFLETANIGEEGTDNFDEALSTRTEQLQGLLSYLPFDDLTSAATTMLNSSDPETKQATLPFIESGYLMVEDTADLSADESGFIEDPSLAKDNLDQLALDAIYIADTPEQQLQAVDLLARHSPEMMTEQVNSILTNISTTSVDVDIRGKAMELAGVSARPDSIVLTQIADELGNPSSKLHTASLNALYNAFSYGSANDKIMTARLAEFEQTLQNLAEDREQFPETGEYARQLLDAFYSQKN